MTTPQPDLRRKYCNALRRALKQGTASDYARAAELGAAALETGVSLSVILQTHHKIVAEALSRESSPVVSARASAFLTAYLAALEDGHQALRVAYQQLAQEKRALEQLPEILLEGIPAMVYVSPWEGQPGEMLYVSPQAEMILGFAAPAWIADAQLWQKLLDPRDREQATTDRVQAQAYRSAYVSEYRLWTRDKRMVWIHDEARIVGNESGQPQYWQGVMLEITQRKAAEKQAAAAERTRLARELHDSVTQTLIAANMHIRTLAKVWQLSPATAGGHVEQIGELTRTALAELRVLLLEMQPAELTRVPLPHLLEQLGAAMQNRGSTTFEIAAVPVPPLSPDVQLVFYRVAQEALNNTIKHGCAQRGWVRLWHEEAQTHLTVSDNGTGFDPQAVPGGHFGLRGMSERAAGIGGQLTIRSAPGAGTVVELVWPAPAPAPNAAAAPDSTSRRTALSASPSASGPVRGEGNP